MKVVEVNDSDIQSEILDYVNKININQTPDFIKEALIYLLPLDEYAKIKDDFIVLNDEK